jgi:hypothetical protein
MAATRDAEGPAEIAALEAESELAQLEAQLERLERPLRVERAHTLDLIEYYNLQISVQAYRDSLVHFPADSMKLGPVLVAVQREATARERLEPLLESAYATGTSSGLVDPMHPCNAEPMRLPTGWLG